MLSLDSPRWQDLKANGDLLEIPKILARIRGASSQVNRLQGIDDLWELVYHQYDIFTASYAVLPYLVDLMAFELPAERIRLIGCIGMIAALAYRPAIDPVPDDLRADYTEALHRAAPLILECFSLSWSDEEHAQLCGALSAVQGHPVMAINLLDTFIDPSAILCDRCQEFFPSFGYVLIKGDFPG